MQSSDRNDEHVPLASYVLVAASWWREIFLGASLAAAAAGALAFLVDVVAPKYAASAGVAIIDTSTTVALDESFQAAESVFLRRGNDRGYLARRAALLGLVKSGNIAEAVVGSMDWLEAEDPMKLSALLESVSAELVTIGAVTDRNQSDLLSITFEADSPEKAVLGANAWATQYVTEVNRVFMPVTTSVVTNVQRRLEEAEDTYTTAQMELEKHLAANNVEQLQRRVDVMREDLLKLNEIRGDFLAMQTDAQTTRPADSLSERHAVRRKLESMLQNAVSLAEHVEAGGEATVLSSSLAVQLLKIQLYGLTGQTAGLEISLSNARPSHADVDSLLKDVNALAGATATHITAVEEEIKQTTLQARSELLDNVEAAEAHVNRSGGDEYASSFPLHRLISSSRDAYLSNIEAVESETQDLLVRLESVSATTKLLTQQRDLAYANLETLQNEVVELQLTSAGSQSVVRFGSPAAASSSARPQPIVVGAALGAAILLLSTPLALFFNSIGVRPFLRRSGSDGS